MEWPALQLAANVDRAARGHDEDDDEGDLPRGHHSQAHLGKKE